MATLLDWLQDTGIFGGGQNGGPSAGAITSAIDPASAGTGFGTPSGAPAPSPSPPMPPVQQTGADQVPLAPSQPDMVNEPNPAAGFGGAQSPPPPVPMPQPRPPGAPQMPPPAGPPTAATAPMAPQQAGAPMSLAPPAPSPSTPVPGSAPGQTALGRMLGITQDQAKQMGGGLAAGLKSVGDNWNKPGLAAFSGSAGSAMEGSQKQADVQSKQATDYLNSAIKARQAGDEAGYKQSYLKYLAAKLQADTDKAASKDATATNKNDTPTQLYLNAQRLVQSDPEVRDASKALTEARKNGTPDEVAKAQALLNQTMQAKQAQHYGALGLNPQAAAQIGKQPGNAIENPIDAGKAGITKDNITKKLQPGQYYTNPSDGKVYQYKGEAKDKGSSKSSSTPDKPTNPEPANPMKPYKTPLEGGDGGSDDED